MGVLSDVEIRERLAAGGLVVGGDPANVDACSYEFRAGMIVKTGVDPESALLDWTQEDAATAVYTVAPGALVWVRTRESVRIPDDLCAFWWQTNRLSRRGLMLVNMTMVEPGYHGPLACLFANFGRQTVEIDRDTVVARLVFFDLNRGADKPFVTTQSQPEYDRALVASATAAPRQFLDLETLSGSVARQLADAEATLLRRRDDLAAELTKAANKAREDASAAFANDTKGTILKSSPLALGMVALVTLASLLGGWLRGQIAPSRDDVRTQVEDTVGELADNAQVTKDVATLRAEVAELRNRLASPAASASPHP
jgi:deoxycytidine triphosphate deaminase